MGLGVRVWEGWQGVSLRSLTAKGEACGGHYVDNCGGLQLLVQVGIAGGGGVSGSLVAKEHCFCTF
jgi:hypothetical protein